MEERLTAARAAEISESFSQLDEILKNIKKNAFKGERSCFITGVLTDNDALALKELGYELGEQGSYYIVEW